MVEVPGMTDYRTEADASAFWRKVDARIAAAVKTAMNAETGIVPNVVYGSAMFNAAGRAVWGSQRGILVSSATVSIPQVIANATTTVIDFDNVINDPYGAISGSGSGWVFTAPFDGDYLVLYGNLLQSTTWTVAGRFALSNLIINGSGGPTLDKQYPISGSVIDPYLHGIVVQPMVAGDTLAITLYQNHGFSLNTGGTPDCFIQIFTVG
jgi:hypothetical protein